MTARETPGDWDDKLAQILADPFDAERTPNDLAIIKAELKQPVSLSRLSSDSSYRKKRDKLKAIVDYNEAKTTNNASPPPNKSKRSTENGRTRRLLIAALALHHKYTNGSVLNHEPIVSNKLAKQAEVGTASASRFFRDNFDGYDRYRSICQTSSSKALVDILTLLNGDFCAGRLYGRTPPQDGDREDED